MIDCSKRRTQCNMSQASTNCARYKNKCLAGYGDYDKKWFITWRMKFFFWFKVHLLSFCREWINDAKFLKYPLYLFDKILRENTRDVSKIRSHCFDLAKYATTEHET